MSEKILSIIVPSYNMEKYLPKCLGSLIVAPELLEKLEVLVVNDGSTDRTSEVAREFADKYPQTFKVIDKANGHYGSCINVGIAEATGNYVKVLDADDTFCTENLARYLKDLVESSREGIDAVLTNYDIVDEHDAVCASVKFGFSASNSFGRNVLAAQRPIPMHAITYRLSLLREMSYRQTEGVSYTDTEWSCFPLSCASRMRYYSYSVYRYLIGRTGQSIADMATLRNVQQLILVAQQMILQMNSRLRSHEDSSITYVHKCIVRICALVYENCLFRASYSVYKQALPRFDLQLLRDAPTIHAVLMNQYLSRRLKIRHYRLWHSISILRTVLRSCLHVYWHLNRLRQSIGCCAVV